MGQRCKIDLGSLDHGECVERALKKIYRCVAASEQSTAKMHQKLKNAGYPETVIEEALARACAIGAIDDRRYAECLIRTTIAFGKGTKFAEREIETLGIDVMSIAPYREHVEKGEAAEVQRAVECLIMHPPHAKRLYDACYRKLISKGYSQEVSSMGSKEYCRQLGEDMQD